MSAPLFSDRDEVREWLASLTDGDVARLAEALFREQERMLPEGDKWKDQTESDRAFWENSALAVIRGLLELRGK